MDRVCALARAKVNLVLDIVGKRPDGYHSIETVMQSLDLSDELAFTVTEQGAGLARPGVDVVEVVCDDRRVPDDSSNLVVKAALRLMELASRTGSCPGGASSGRARPVSGWAPGRVRIEIHKRIPVAAGLAGGSADAAAALIALNVLWGLGFSLDELMRVGASIGADVPFCTTGGTCLARGRGDEILPLAHMPDAIFVLLISDVGLSTKEIYQSYDACGHEGAVKWAAGGGIGELPTAGIGPRPAEPSGRVAAMIRAIQAGELPSVGRSLYNALEPVAADRMPAIRQARNLLVEAGALGAAMSGSGPTVLGLFDPETFAGVRDVIMERAHSIGWRAESCRPAGEGVHLVLEGSA